MGGTPNQTPEEGANAGETKQRRGDQGISYDHMFVGREAYASVVAYFRYVEHRRLRPSKTGELAKCRGLLVQH